MSLINNLSTNKIIVIGGSGFLGSQIIKTFQNHGLNNIACGDINENENINCDFIKIDLLDYSNLSKNLSTYDLIINCTGQITDPFNLCFKLNSDGINNLLKSLNTKTHLIHISTVSVYGSGNYCDEDSMLNPETNYAVAKAFAEKKIIEQCDEKLFTILRLSNLYGKNQRKGISAYLINSYLTDKVLSFNNNGKLIRSYMHVSDCAKIIYQIAKNKLYGVYNVKGDETLSIIELLNRFEKEFNMKFQTYFSNIEPWENILNLSNSKLNTSIAYENSWTLIDYFKSQIKNEKN